MSARPVDLGDVKEGSFVVVDDEPCRVVEVEKSKPGKHGSAKIRLVAIGFFTGSKKSYMGPSSSKIDVPEVEKRVGQILNVSNGTVQLMDLETFETFETQYFDEDIASRLEPGAEVEYWRIMGKSKITKVKK
ncbi:translation initiation factor IF-5A [Conexivisphaera calida]|uniref:translation initiation factor IF-5A n=1 Tax=Conexivisphaera calida TaxID=1874277 RepID=UPI00157A5019|nr:translation initiation factor IF-5A [Conexivisphaera calida]